MQCKHVQQSCCPQDLPAPQGLDPEVTAAFDVAYANIRAFHEAQRTPTLEVETMPGVICRRVTRPISECCSGAVGPGGARLSRTL